MDGDPRYSIGDLARRTGLTVKAIRFYSDRGIVPPAGRSPAGHRRYDLGAVARLDLVRTLRELGLDLATIRKVVDREISLPEVAAAHAEALALQIRLLRLRRSVLVAVASRGSTPQEMKLMHQLAKLSEDERRHLIDDFLRATFRGLDDAAFTGIMRSMTAELPDDPEAGQVEAWLELAELSQDRGFRDSMRRLAEHHTAECATGTTPVPGPDLIALVRDESRAALAAGLSPDSPEAGPVVTAVATRYARILDLPDDGELRRRLSARVGDANDPRRERYLRLLAVVNGWAAPESPAPALGWFLRALRAHPR
ncbi:MerR family transcriptional regulator [Amycolatopsis rhizosphaerae]|uniref:MerR family transcriptional regulator n=1 Tax=Amycolatopsis rhizosphaerae TaxID=2053003 RepID=A0A558DEC1_9PSEU|nr:MerR family transcriptional regulator [Amycolatopsis rhizosphaerae]TVT59371.1 MerR family transcriptional regulator [Amycolatopsis rhizosphaerae]